MLPMAETPRRLREIVSEQQLRVRLEELGEALSRDYADRVPVIVVIAEGARRLADALVGRMRARGVQPEIVVLRASRTRGTALLDRAAGGPDSTESQITSERPLTDFIAAYNRFLSGEEGRAERKRIRKKKIKVRKLRDRVVKSGASYGERLRAATEILRRTPRGVQILSGILSSKEEEFDAKRAAAMALARTHRGHAGRRIFCPWRNIF